ncbi:glycosyltransferase [Yeosuana sp. AK3]
MSKKICILTDSLSSGGAEKMAANLSISLNNKGYNISIVSMTNFIDYKFEGELYNFGVVKEKYNRLQAFLRFKQYFKENKFDIIIDFRLRNKFFKELLFSKYIFKNHRVFYCVHSYHLEYYFSYIKSPWLAKLPHVSNRIFIVVSNEIKNHLHNKLKIKSKTIYNYLDFESFSEVPEDDKATRKNYIIGVGRLDKIKQFDLLIKSYQAAQLHKKGINLIILGNGPEKESLESLISKLKLESYVSLKPFTKKPYQLIKNAKVLVLTSNVEGFPMVLLEAISLKTPVIAFDCKSGPSEIVVNEQNGLLIDDQNEEQIKIALNRLMFDNVLYSKIKANIHVDLDKFSENKIIQDWINLIENQR